MTPQHRQQLTKNNLRSGIWYIYPPLPEVEAEVQNLLDRLDYLEALTLNLRTKAMERGQTITEAVEAGAKKAPEQSKNETGE